jgi:hypothetical protein
MQRLQNPNTQAMVGSLLDLLPDLVPLIKESSNNVAKIQRLLAYNYGEASAEIAGYRLDGPEYIDQLRTRVTNESDALVADFTAQLQGKPATFGAIVNMGTEMALVWFENLDRRSEKAKKIGPLYLAPGAVKSITRFTEKIYITSDSGAEVWLQVDVQ